MRKMGLYMMAGIIVGFLALGIFTKKSSQTLISHNKEVEEKQAQNAAAVIEQREEDKQERASEAENDNMENGSLIDSSSLYAAVNLFSENANDGDADHYLYTCGGTDVDGVSHKYQINCCEDFELTWNIDSRNPFEACEFDVGLDQAYQTNAAFFVSITDEYGLLKDADTGESLSFEIDSESGCRSCRFDVSGSTEITLHVSTSGGGSDDYLALVSDGLILFNN